MTSRGRSRRTAVAVGAALASTLGAGVASAHGVGASRFDAPLPLGLLFGGAGATVALTALWLGAAVDADGAPATPRRVLTIPSQVATRARSVLGVLFLTVVVASLVAGALGRQAPAENLATAFTWPVWFRGLALLAILVGDPWPTLSPWRTVYRGLCRLEGRRLAVLGEYPDRLGAWPALVGFLALVGVLENLTAVPRSPRLTAAVIALYALAMIGGAVLYGPAWLRRADPRGVFYHLLGRVAPVGEEGRSGRREVRIRAPWRGCLEPVADAPLVAFVVATVYTVSFDGFTNGRSFQTVLFAARNALGTGPGTSVLLYLAGLVGFVAAFALCSWLVERLGAGTGSAWPEAARRLAPTLLPIAAAYEVAHNYPYVLRNLGQFVGLAARPAFPSGGPVELLGWLSLPAFWWSQVALIVVGHVVAVAAAHHVAADRYGTAAAARRGHLPLVALMVGYTVLSLWIVSQPVVAG